MQVSAARIVTTTEKFDEMGKLVERITKEEFEEEECGCKCAGRKEKKENSGLRENPLINGSPHAREMHEEILKEAKKERLSKGITSFLW